MTRAFGFMHSCRVVLSLGWADFVLKYRGSVLGYLWSFLAPLAQFIVLLHVLRPFVGQGIPSYPLYLFLGIIVWEYIATTTSGCIAMLRDKASIIQRVVLPHEVLVYSTGCTNMIVFLTRLCIFFAACAFMRVMPASGVAWLPLLLIQMSLLSLGIGMLLSAYSLKFRDIGHMWGLLLQALFWLTPVAYASRDTETLRDGIASMLTRFHVSSLADLLDLFIRFQPFSLQLTAMRRSLLPAMPGGVPSWLHMTAVTGVCAFIFAAGLIVFRSRSRYFIQEL